MKQTLPDIIRENKDLLSVMLEQEGFMKYVAEHLDDDGLTLYARYQEQVVSDYRKSNMWNPDVQLLQGDELWLKALGPSNHLLPEFRCRMAFENLIAGMPDDTGGTVRAFYDGYMGYAWREYFEHRNPEHATDLGFYKTLMEQFSHPDGLACRCLELTLKEYHERSWTEGDKYDYYRIAEYYYFYFDMSYRQGKQAFDRLRNGVKAWLEGKSGEECRELAVDMLEKARWFSQHIYNDKSVCSLNGVPFPLEDKKWLREMARSLGKKTGIMAPYFSEFVFLLQEVGRIWAARLLKEHLIDLHTLEKETNSFLMPYEAGKDGFDYHYYVDHYYTNDSPNTCCVNNNLKAKKLLYERYGKNLELELEELTGDKLDSHSSGNTRGGDNVNQGVPNVAPFNTIMWTNRAKCCFEEAVKKGWMKKEKSKYVWCGIKKKPSGKVNMSELAYFLGKVYGFVFKDGNNIGAKLPANELNEYFGFNKKSMTDSLLQLYRANNIQAFRNVIDDLFNTIDQSKEEN